MPEPDMKALLLGLIAGEASQADMEAMFHIILSGDASPQQIAAFMAGLAVRGESPTDIAAGAKVLRQQAITIRVPEAALDIVGTGGDGAGSWNISTAAAIVTAGAGFPVAKHGNRAVSSKSGAADVLEALGVKIDADLALVQQAFDDANIAFLLAPRHHSAMRHVAPIRGELGFRSIFNLLGPLSNPALVKRIMIGVFAKQWLKPFAEALIALGTSHGLVVHGQDGLDEVTTTGKTDCVLVRNGKLESIVLHPEDIGLAVAKADTLIGGSPEDNAKAMQLLFAGEDSPMADITLLNAAAAIYGTGHAASIKDAAALAKDAIASGKAAATLKKLVAITNQGS